MRWIMIWALLVVGVFAQDEVDMDKERFTPITEGNVLQAGPFTYRVPAGNYYAFGADATHMFRLLHAESIPNCEGVFFSASATWTYGVSLQWFSSSDLLFQPKINHEKFIGLLNNVNFKTGRQSKEPHQVVYPFEINEDENSAFFGFRTMDSGHDEVLARKIYLADEGVLVLTLVSKGDQHEFFEKEILNVFSAVDPVAFTPRKPEAGAQSYLNFFGIPLKITPTPPPPSAETEATEAEPEANYTMSIVVIAASVVVLGFAFVLSRKG